MPESPATAPRERPSWFARLRTILAARKDPARLGDVALMQSDLLGFRMSADTSSKVDALVERRGPAALRPPLDFAALRDLPDGTFGRAFIEFCDRNKIIPVTFSDAVEPAELRRMAAAARYIATHDMIHVLLGHDTSIPGELGVIGFAIGQNYFRGGRLIFALQVVVGSLMRPHLAHRSVANLRAGYRLGKRVPNLLAQPFEALFAEDLEHVRRRVGLA
jgi:ubiquinone biosynthesis protein COQ4